MTEKHVQKHTITEYINYPDHDDRKESALFRKNRVLLLRTMKCGCWICDSKEKLEVHHLHEWALWDALDHNKVLDTLKAIDIYGFTKQDSITPIESPDDKRNLVVLCGSCEINGQTVAGGHHRGVSAGAHALTMPIWLAQRAVKPGLSITQAISAINESDKKISKRIITEKCQNK